MKWTEKEVEFLKKNSCMPNKWLASTLGRTVGSISEKKYMLNIRMDDEIYMPEKLTQQEKEARIIKLAADMRVKLKGW